MTSAVLGTAVNSVFVSVIVFLTLLNLRSSPKDKDQDELAKKHDEGEKPSRRHVPFITRYHLVSIPSKSVETLDEDMVVKKFTSAATRDARGRRRPRKLKTALVNPDPTVEVDAHAEGGERVENLTSEEERVLSADIPIVGVTPPSAPDTQAASLRRRQPPN